MFSRKPNKTKQNSFPGFMKVSETLIFLYTYLHMLMTNNHQ